MTSFGHHRKTRESAAILVRDIVCKRAYGDAAAIATIIASSLVSDDEALPAKSAGCEEIPDLLNWIEEADARLVVHVDWAVRVKPCKRIVIVSNNAWKYGV